jgi:Flp pilus assembly protein TadD
MRARFCLAQTTAAALVAISTIGLGGCQTTATTPDITGSLGDKAEKSPESGAQRTVDSDGDRFRANPQDPDAALNYAQSLRHNGQRQQAVKVLEKATLIHPGNKALLGGYGRALADNGDFQRAFDVLSQAHDPENPDWRILSVQGAALDLLGRHDEARRYYASALKLAPDEPSVLSNYGLSYLLSKDPAKSEDLLRKAYDRGSSDPRVRQNLALALGLQGKYAEAEALVKVDLPPDKASANVAYLKKMLERARRGASNGPPGQRPNLDPVVPTGENEQHHG